MAVDAAKLTSRATTAARAERQNECGAGEIAASAVVPLAFLAVSFMVASYLAARLVSCNPVKSSPLAALMEVMARSPWPMVEYWRVGWGE
ncbi:MAG: hypothetical protein ACK49R_02350 [Planctomycetota bacterium]